MSAGPSDLAAWLGGRWSVSRTINGDRGHFSGTAVFTTGPDGVTHWDEQGDLTLGTYTGPARRALTLRDGQVRFDDGRPFHDLDLSAGHWQPIHLCGPDTYHGAFVVDPDDPHHFTVAWHVTGPGRDDTIVSDYRRAPADGTTAQT